MIYGLSLCYEQAGGEFLDDVFLIIIKIYFVWTRSDLRKNSERGKFSSGSVYKVSMLEKSSSPLFIFNKYDNFFLSPRLCGV